MKWKLKGMVPQIEKKFFEGSHTHKMLRTEAFGWDEV
jgi:hypothetical protein